jgi:hypothetical protein
MCQANNPERSVLFWLPSNNVNYGPSFIEIRLNKDNDYGQAIIEIIDNGPGIPKELLPDALFEPYLRSYYPMPFLSPSRPVNQRAVVSASGR